MLHGALNTYPATTHAYSKLPAGPLPNHTHEFRINSQTFASANLIPGFTEEDYRYWIRQAASLWRTEGGAGIIYENAGVTNGGCVKDGVSTIVAITSCINPEEGCSSLARTNRYLDSQDQLTGEIDICITNYNGSYFVDPSNSQNKYDFIRTVAHEFGHVWGLDHESGTLMASSLNKGIYDRHLRPDDIQGIMSMYGPDYKVPYWTEKHYNETNFDWLLNYFGAGTPWPISGAIGHDAAPGIYSQKLSVVRSRVAQISGEYQPTNIVAYRSSMPLSNTSTWNYTYLTVPPDDAWGQPAIACNGNYLEDPAWIIAYRDFSTNLKSTNGIRTFLSTDAFATFVAGPIIIGPAKYDPTLAFDPSTNSFILVVTYGQSADIYVSHNNGQSWLVTGETLTNVLGKVDASCDEDGLCHFAFMEFNNNNRTRIRYEQFTVIVPGNVSILGAWTKDVVLPWAPQMTYLNFENAWFQSRIHNQSDEQEANGGGLFRHRKTTSTPPSGWSTWTYEYGVILNDPHELVSDPEGFPYLYTFGVDTPMF